MSLPAPYTSREQILMPILFWKYWTKIFEHIDTGPCISDCMSGVLALPKYEILLQFQTSYQLYWNIAFCFAPSFFLRYFFLDVCNVCPADGEADLWLGYLSVHSRRRGPTAPPTQKIWRLLLITSRKPMKWLQWWLLVYPWEGKETFKRW